MSKNAAVGDLALLKEDNVPPPKWSLVRIVQVHSGLYGVVRTVTVRNSRVKSLSVVLQSNWHCFPLKMSSAPQMYQITIVTKLFYNTYSFFFVLLCNLGFV